MKSSVKLNSLMCVIFIIKNRTNFITLLIKLLVLILVSMTVSQITEISVIIVLFIFSVMNLSQAVYMGIVQIWGHIL